MVRQISNDGMLDLADVLTLAIVGCALAGEASPKGFSNGPFSWEEERVLTDSLLEAIFKGPSKLALLSRLQRALESHWEGSKAAKPVVEKQEDDWGEWEGVEDESEDGDYLEAHLKLEIRDWLKDLMSRLHCISRARARLPVALRSSEEQVFSMGLLQKLFSLIFSKSDVPGLHHHILSVGRIFKSGLGRFGLGHVGETKTGRSQVNNRVCYWRNSRLRDTGYKGSTNGVQGAEGVEVLIGGTTFLSPSDTRDLLLASH
ncbi:hypothetical protein M758_3G001100 [Ceratodon purpureus]|uniref:Uncharacterized protein n=1 Tax=Ceratodon purpureus TaxID=3225 RepID=A0A8T0IFB2_CERPU|nr:hypothetical protein KC19_3G000900 [Ceratodon purpureus]KAG0621190.1 hypothetical protein M758_3G001100 [Ceratodon purpureus]KAG0621191.1 hypothetical protein M758_3G001100 [Ceratodon purpureus]KAG0621192.1 hypothetical protein M758_3G001100 [Ceratodon purpureus]